MRKAFTLIELMIVIMILGVLAALISGNFISSLKKGRDAQRKSDLAQMQRALEMYYDDFKVYPTATANPGLSFGDPLSEVTSGKIYMQRLPKDPSSSRTYEYQSINGKDYQLYACLENDQQNLPYSSLTGTAVIATTCGNCYYQGGTIGKCIWGVSSSNTTP